MTWINEWPGYCTCICMDTQLKLAAPWEQVKEKLKEANSELTDDDLNYQPGRDQDLLETLARKMNRDVPSIKAWIESVDFTDGIAS
jgi:hypothetical protein